MTRFTAFYYKGKPIENIEAWAKERGCKMVKYICEIHEVNPFSGRVEVREEEGEMPEAMWNIQRISTEPGRHEIYREISRREPAA